MKIWPKKHCIEPINCFYMKVHERSYDFKDLDRERIQKCIIIVFVPLKIFCIILSNWGIVALKLVQIDVIKNNFSKI